MQPWRDLDLSEKVAYLRRPEAYPDTPDSVDVTETHFAWVFLSRRFVYKLKKPVRFPDLDLTTAPARRANCELEIALNRRLAAGTYIGVVALGRRGLRPMLECDRNPVDWLVKMHRLPAEDVLERLLPDIDAADPRLTRLLDTLREFYSRTARAPWSGADYVRALERQCRHQVRQLMVPLLAPEHDRVQAIGRRQQAFIDGHGALLEARVGGRRICDAHGDLRPEHIFLTKPPQIIDCLEFSAALRQLDAAEELGFLALECDKLGRTDIGLRLRRLYRESCRDAVPDDLFDFYRSRRALVRAYLSAWHVDEDLDGNEAQRWLDQARWYIDEAESSIDRASSAIAS